MEYNPKWRDVGYWEIEGKECLIFIKPRPPYCDRANYTAHLDNIRGELARDLDGADMWPRPYFDFEVAKLECEAWLKKRKQWVEGATWHESPSE